MAVLLKKGITVRSEKHGEGVIDRVEGSVAVVAYSHWGLSLRVPVGELEIVKGVKTVGSDSGARASTAPKTNSNGAVVAIEALRFGVVPGHALDRLTVGFDSLKKWVVSNLPRGGPIVSEVCGGFGTGKSHAMAVIRAVAEDEGYLAAHVEVNGTGVSLRDPGPLLFQLLETVEGKEFDDPARMVALNVRARQRGSARAMEELERYPRLRDNYDTVAFLKDHGHLDEFEQPLDLLMSSNNDLSASEIRKTILAEIGGGAATRVQPKRLIGIPVDERPDDFADCLLGYARMARLAGFKGLAITLDEFEVEYRAGHFTWVPERVIALIDRLEERLEAAEAGEPLGIFVATVGQRGEDSDPLIAKLVAATGGDRKVLRAWSAADLRRLSKRIFDLYSEAYGLTARFSEDLVDKVERSIEDGDTDKVGQVRAFIKTYVAELDRKHGPPSR